MVVEGSFNVGFDMIWHAVEMIELGLSVEHDMSLGVKQACEV